MMKRFRSARAALALPLLAATLLYGGHAHAIPTIAGETPSLAPMLEDVLPSVVNIKITARRSAQQNPLMEDPFFRRFFGIPEERQQRDSQPVGSGVIVDIKEGLVLTNHHVIAQADSIVVNLASGRDIPAELVGSDPDTDIAVLRIDASGLRALPIADSDKLRVGDFVLAIGNPFGLGQTVTSGIVSALGRVTGGEGYQDFIQTDAAINPGNSGGALVNLKGELIGINSQILSRGGGNIGIGFAIPTNLASAVMEQLVEHGDVQRGRIGIVGQTLTQDLAEAFGRDLDGGVIISQVAEGSEAEKAGLQSEDIIISVDGKPVPNMIMLRNHIGLKRIGEKVTLTVLRNGRERRFQVAIGGDEELERVSEESLHPRLEGAKLSGIPDDHPQSGRVDGVLVREVAAGSPAARAGLRPGDIITAANRTNVTGLSDLAEIASQSEQLLLHIRRGNGALFLLLQ